jgi:hypothetical protein
VAVRIRLAIRPVEDRRACDDVTEVRVRRVDPGVEHGNGGRARGGNVPVDLIPTDPRERPLVGILGIARRRLYVAYLIGLNTAHCGVGLQRSRGGV